MPSPLTDAYEKHKKADQHLKEENYDESFDLYYDAVGIYKELLNETIDMGENGKKTIRDLLSHCVQGMARSIRIGADGNENEDQFSEHQGNQDGTAQMQKISVGKSDEIVEIKEMKEMKFFLKTFVVAKKPDMTLDDVAGMKTEIDAILKAAVDPIMNPELYNTDRPPDKAILMFGPPGTGKTSIAKGLANKTNSTFINLPIDGVLSKWSGRSETLVRALFELAAELSPTIIFIDEINGLCGTSSNNESDTTKRFKAALLVQLDGYESENARILVIGATNSPWDLESNFQRRFTRKFLISLPDDSTRKSMFKINMKSTWHLITDEQMDFLSSKSDGFSGSDIKLWARRAMDIADRRYRTGTHFIKLAGSLDNVGFNAPKNVDGKIISCHKDQPGSFEWSFDRIKKEERQLPPVNLFDYVEALNTFQQSVKPKDELRHRKYNDEFGDFKDQGIIPAKTTKKSYFKKLFHKK